MKKDAGKELIPPSLTIALDVSDEEFRQARRQNALLWLGTMAGILGATFLWFTGVLRVEFFLLIPLVPWLVQGILGGLGAHAVLRLVFRDAPKVNTMKFRKYKELRQWRASQGKKVQHSQDSAD